MESLQTTISEIREEFYIRTPYITGTVPLKATQSKLFYSTDELFGSVDFFKATQSDLKWEFDSAPAVFVDPCTAAFTAFFSDVEHEVTPMISGYRVTITYNLYFGAAIDPTPSAQLIETAAKIHVSTRLREQFEKLLKNPCFLPEGGYIGVHLLHRYPFDSRDRYVKLKDLEKYLKGVDSDIFALFREFKLDANLKKCCTRSRMDEFTALPIPSLILMSLRMTNIGQRKRRRCPLNATFMASGKPRPSYLHRRTGAGTAWSDEGNQRKYSPIFWLRGDVDDMRNHKKRYYTYTAGRQYYYGNEADWSVYQELALVARLGPVHQRKTEIQKCPKENRAGKEDSNDGNSK